MCMLVKYNAIFSTEKKTVFVKKVSFYFTHVFIYCWKFFSRIAHREEVWSMRTRFWSTYTDIYMIYMLYVWIPNFTEIRWVKIFGYLTFISNNNHIFIEFENIYNVFLYIVRISLISIYDYLNVNVKKS